jgi:Kef-type K+ transport system membrane component KefB/nucleotide-binding universal stress UspA family protein
MSFMLAILCAAGAGVILREKMMSAQATTGGNRETGLGVVSRLVPPLTLWLLSNILVAPLAGASAQIGHTVPPAASSGAHAIPIFIAEILLMLVVGRALGEFMRRIGQPEVMGQLIAGIVLGPSVLGTLWPSAHGFIFPDAPEQKKMIDAVSQLGILMLLLLTGMETDLGLVKKMRRTALFSSLSGIALPFLCGYLLGEFLPDSMLPNPKQRLPTSLFLATALSISSVKIVAMVIMEVGFLRRNVGQIIMAAAIIDDTVGWIIISIIGGIAARGFLDLPGLGFTVLGTLLFLGFSFTLGRRLVAHVIRWTNDHLIIEMPVISAILVLTFVMALATDLLGVHTILGAFVIGILVGQSPILTGHVQEELRGLIVALFAPIFFAVAGLSIDLTALKSFNLLALAVAFIFIASFGKVVGCYIGGRLGGLSSREATALAIGMNARGSTEVIVATIGLSLGVLNRDLFTLIVVMAVTTTMVMPPMLRWALVRIPATGEERDRLAGEEMEATDLLGSVERILIAVDGSEHGKLASKLAGLFAGARNVTFTVLHLTGGGLQKHHHDSSRHFGETMEDSVTRKDDEQAILAGTPSVLSVEDSGAGHSAAALKAAGESYGMLFVGVGNPWEPGDRDPAGFNPEIEKIVSGFDGKVAIVVAKGRADDTEPGALDILVPITGSAYSRLAAEVAVAIAKASGGKLTALHVYQGVGEDVLARRNTGPVEVGMEIVSAVAALGEREGVHVKSLVRVHRDAERTILQQVSRGKHNLVVFGGESRTGEKLFFGHTITALVDRIACSVLIVSS